jgi:hypothetical protein
VQPLPYGLLGGLLVGRASCEPMEELEAETLTAAATGAHCGRRTADNHRAEAGKVVKAPDVRTLGFAGSPAIARRRARAQLRVSSCGRNMREVSADVTNLL